MGLPFGKIIQNGVEYDVSPNRKSITVNGSDNKTYKQILNDLAIAASTLITNATDEDLANAKLIIKGYNNFERVFSFSEKNFDTGTKDLYFGCAEVANNSSVSVYSCKLSTQSAQCYYTGVNLTSAGNTITDMGAKTSWASSSITLLI